MREFPINEAFDSLRTRIFRIENKWTTENGKTKGGHATAFAVARFKYKEVHEKTGQRIDRLLLATAGHVLAVPSSIPVQWTVQQWDERLNSVRKLSFWTNHPDLEKGQVPYNVHKKVDVAVFAMPYLNEAGEPFSTPEEEPLVLIDKGLMITTGTRVGWAGFPGPIQKVLRIPVLCYAEGVVSAEINSEERHLYIVDGHNVHGFSGGPVWRWAETKKSFEVVGIVSGYLPSSKPGLPGFCFFEPINHICFLLDCLDKKEDVEVVRL